MLHTVEKRQQAIAAHCLKPSTVDSSTRRVFDIITTKVPKRDIGTALECLIVSNLIFNYEIFIKKKILL